MRARPPRAGNGSSCTRCAGVLRPGAALCSLCGWPAGQDAPAAETVKALPTESEREPADPPSSTDTRQLADVAAAQLEVLDARDEAGQDDGTQTTDDAEAEDDDAPPSVPPDGDEPPGSGLHRAPRTPEVHIPSLDPLTAPLSLLTKERPGLPEPLLADELDTGPARSTPGPSSQIVLDPVWDMVPEPESEDLDALVPAAPDLRPIRRLAWLAAAGIVSVSVLAVSVPLVAWVIGVLGVAEGSALTLAGAAAGATIVVALVVSGVFFLTWVGRARSNVEEMSPVAQRWSRPVAVGGWLIPLAGPFIGWQVLRDLWAGSDPATREATLVRQPDPLLVTSWLAALAVSSVVSLAGRFVLGGSPLVDVVAGVAVALSGACLVATVMRISRWQQP